MVVGVEQGGDPLGAALQILYEGLRTGDAGQQQDLLLAVPLVWLALEEGGELPVVHAREVELLVGVEVELLADDVEVDGLDGVGAFGDHHDLCPVFAGDRLAEPAGGQEGVVGQQAVAVGQQQVESGLEVAMLVGIVQQDDIHMGVLEAEQLFHAVAAMLVDADYGLGKLALHLCRFVADVGRRAGRVGQAEASGPTLVAPAQGGHLQAFVLQQPDEVFGVGRLARASYGQVADADGGYRKAP